MKPIFSVLLILILCLGCTTHKDKNQVFIFNDISFQLNEGDSIAEINPLLSDRYQSYSTNRAIQIPLYKCINNKAYDIYLGIPYNTSIEKIVHLHLMDSTLKQEELNTDTLTYCFTKQHNDTTYSVEYTKVFNSNLIYVLATTQSKIIADSLLTQRGLSTRLIQN